MSNLSEAFIVEEESSVSVKILLESLSEKVDDFGGRSSKVSEHDSSSNVSLAWVSKKDVKLDFSNNSVGFKLVKLKSDKICVEDSEWQEVSMADMERSSWKSWKLSVVF